MKKQLLLVLLALMPMVPILASVEQVQIDGLWYNIVSKAKVADLITLRTGSYSGDIIIPESITYDGVVYRVGSISGAFKDCKRLTSVTIPNSVTTIGDNAFAGCTGLTSITIPNSVTSIGENAFSGCTGLTSISIPDGVTSIGGNAFLGISGLTTITIPNGVTSINGGLFSGCTGLSSIVIPDGVTFIGIGAFYGCSSLISINIPSDVTFIGERAFMNCTVLSSITIPDGVTSIEGHTFSGCKGLTSITIPNSVTSIGEYAFYGCSGLTSLPILNSVSSIGNNAFYKCSGLNSFTIGDCVTNIGSDAFYCCSNLTSIYFGNNIARISSTAFNECTSLNSVFINNLSSWCKNTFSDYYSNPLSIAHHLFVNGEEVSDLIIPNDVTTINDYSFYGCSYLNSITIGNSVTNIGNDSFAYCENITDVYSYAETVPTTHYNAFRGSYIQYATLHVPADLIGAYRTTAPWNEILNIVPIEGEIPKVNKCATPTIEYSNGNVICNCETDGVKYIYQIAPVTVQRESESGRFAFAPTYEIKVYAKREGYKDSDTASLIVSLTNVGDVNGDGQVSIADVTSLVNSILGK